MSGFMPSVLVLALFCVGCPDDGKRTATPVEEQDEQLDEMSTDEWNDDQPPKDK